MRDQLYYVEVKFSTDYTKKETSPNTVLYTCTCTNKLINKNLINQVISYWTSHRSSVSCIGPVTGPIRNNYNSLQSLRFCLNFKLQLSARNGVYTCISHLLSSHEVFFFFFFFFFSFFFSSFMKL